jgi:hypothetical protein
MFDYDTKEKKTYKHSAIWLILGGYAPSYKSDTSCFDAFSITNTRTFNYKKLSLISDFVDIVAFKQTYSKQMRKSRL